MADGSVKIDITADDSDVKKKLDGVGDAAEDAADGVDKLTDSTDDAGQGLGGLDVAVGNLVSNGLSSLIGKLGESVSALFELAESTREYREDMAKLDAAFTTTGHSTEAAHASYKDFYAILGESDRSVEAVNHLAELTSNEQELAQWSTIAAGVTAKFGDSLPIEGLTEAANETAKVSKTTGVLADALNWASADSETFKNAFGSNNEALTAFNNAIAEGLPVEDAFTAALLQMSTEQERSQAITNTLTGLYSDEAAKYNELTDSTQAARRATAEMEEAQANLGAAVEPVTTAWTDLKAKALDAITPVVETLAGKFSELIGWLQEHPAVLAGLTGALAALGIALGVVTAATIAQTVAQWAQNAAWLANPITWIIIAIVAAVGAVVGAFLYLWNNCDAFREFFINLWEVIKSAVSTAWEAIKGFFVAAWEAIKSAWSACGEFFSGLWEGIKIVFSVVGEWFANIFSSAWEGIKSIWNAVTDFFKGIWDGIVAVFSAVGSWFAGVFSAAWDGIKNIWSAVTGFFSGIWNGIVAVFSAVGSWFSGIFSSAWDGIKSVWSGVTSFFSGIWTNIKNVFSSAKDSFLSIGRNIIDGLKQGISNAWNNLKSWFTGLFDDLIGIAKKILGIHSPSTKFRYIAEMIVAGMQQGLDKNRDIPSKALHGVFDEMQKVVDERAKEQIKTIADYNAEIEKENTDHTKELEKIDAEFAKSKAKSGADIAELTQKYNEDIEKENTRHAESLAKIEDNINGTIGAKMQDLLDLEKDYNDNVTKLWDDLEKDITDLQQKYDDQLASRTASIANSLNLWDEATKNAVNGKDLKNNLKSQVDMLEDYNEAIASLEGRNISADFINQLKEMGVDATGEIEALAKMSDSELAEYVALWEKKNALAHDAAVEELEPLKAETEAEIQALTDAALNKYTEYRTTFAEQSMLLMQDLKSSITEAGTTGYEDIISYVDDYTSAGEDLMDGVVMGIMDKSPIVADAVADAVSRAIEAAKAEAGIHSPSTVMRDEVGKQMGAGFIEGWHNKVAAIKKAMSTDIQGITATVRATVGAENAKYGYNAGVADTGMSDLTRAVGIQTAGINSLAGEFNRGTRNTRPVVIELNGRELGRTVVDVGGTERTRVGGTLAVGGAY